MKKSKGKHKRLPKNKFNDEKFNNMENNKVKVSNLSDRTTVGDLFKLFGNVGMVYNIRIDKMTNSAVVIFTSEDTSRLAIEQLNDALLDNRITLTLHNTSLIFRQAELIIRDQNPALYS